MKWKARALQAEARNKILEELREDVERWRESGDARDLLYILETLEKCDAMDSKDSFVGVNDCLLELRPTDRAEC